MTVRDVDQVGVCAVCRYEVEHIPALTVAGQGPESSWKHVTPRPHPARPIPGSIRTVERTAA